MMFRQTAVMAGPVGAAESGVVTMMGGGRPSAVRVMTNYLGRGGARRVTGEQGRGKLLAS